MNGSNILHTPLSLEEFCAANKLNVDELRKKFDAQRKILLHKREKRIHPFKDDKILSAWNGLMIYTLAEAGKAFQEDLYLQAALKAARFIKKNLWIQNELLRRWRDGQAMFSGSLDEYASMIRASLSLFEANAGVDWLQWAIEMSQTLREKYKAEEGAFYQTDGTDKNLILRRCQFSDGAEPSGNAVHGENLLRLHQLTLEDHYLQQAEDIFKGVRDYLENYPPGYCYHVMNVLRYYVEQAPTFVIALNSNREYEKELKEALYEKFIPHKAVIWQSHDVELEELLPYTKEQIAQNDKTTLYLCDEGTCQKPVDQLTDMLNLVRGLTMQS